MARISTGTGDDGTTGLVGGRRIRKSSTRMDALGAIDETNDLLGVAAAHTQHEPLVETLRSIQADLFTLGADIATPGGEGAAMRITAAHVARLEREEDRIETALPPLTKFILPGGTPAAAYLQLARSVARRAERAAWRLHEADGDVTPEALRYLNRLSDLLFLLAREENRREGREDSQWLGRSAK